MRQKSAIELEIIGYVVSPINDISKMPSEGVPAVVIIDQKFEVALKNFEENTHYYILGWLDQSDRSILEVSPRKKRELPPKGVFSLRAPVRPNPISLSIGRLLNMSRSAGGFELSFDALDLIDQTPILDIKPYTVGWDMVFSARNAGEPDLYRRLSRSELLTDMARQAARYHGKLCIGGMIGVRAAYVAFIMLDLDLRSKELTIMVNARPCTVDAIAAVTSATARRLKSGEPEGRIVFATPSATLELLVTSEKITSLEHLESMSDEDLFKAQFIETPQ